MNILTYIWIAPYDSSHQVSSRIIPDYERKSQHTVFATKTMMLVQDRQSETLTGIREGDVMFFEIRRTGMAPDSRFWRHQPGEAAVGIQQRCSLKPTLVLCLLLTLIGTKAKARTEFNNEHVDVLSSSSGYEKANHEGVGQLSSLPSPPVCQNSSPAGRWNDGIQIHIPHQPVIEKYVRYYNGRGKSTITEALERSWSYVPVMSEILESHGVPHELVYVALVESSFKRKASLGGARGYWQLLGSTARSMGLRVDRWVDERMDPIKSTHAAAKYLRSLYNQYHCWELALAAYNSGAGPVESAMRKHQCSDFWEIYKCGALPDITLAYVPKVLAAIQVVRDLESRNYRRPVHLAVFDFEPILVRSALKLEQVAGWIDVPVTQLQDLNSSLCQDQVPPDHGFLLRLPSGFRDKFNTAYEDYLRKH